jgi:hypothetical protein
MLNGTRDRRTVRYLLSFFLILCSTSFAHAQIAITPSTPPVVNQGTTYKFTANVPVTWSVAQGSKGTVDADGTYHAPALVTAQQSIGGCQLLPNNHIINTRIDSLPVNTNSTTWIASTIAGFVGVLYISDVPVNYVNASTPTQNMVFQYTPLNNGPFTFPPYPIGKIQSGWLSDPLNLDHHMYIVNPSTCGFQEIYDYYPVGTNTGAPTTNSVSGIKYNNSDYALPASGGPDAAGMTMEAMQLHFQEWQNAVNTGGTINHALRFTLPTGVVNGSSFLWPATVRSYAGVGSIPYGARIRLKSSFNISGFSPQAQVLLKQAQQYGFILDDIGYTFDVPIDYTKLPYAYQHAVYPEIAHANITPLDFEFVDESSLEVSAKSGLTTANLEAVCAASSTASTCMPVALTGVTVGIPSDQMYLQAGTGPRQLTAWVNGSSNTGVTWTMNPSVGTLTTGGLYTPPSVVTNDLATQVTVTANANPNVSATMTLVVLTQGSIRIIMGGPCGSSLSYYVASAYSCSTAPFVDSHNNAWQGETGDDGGSFWSSANGTPPFPNVPDIYLYETPYQSGGNDMRFDLVVPNGTYSITGKFDNSSTSATGSLMSLEAQGTVQYSKVDIIAASGGEYKPIDFTLKNVAVTNGLLSFVVRYVSGPVGSMISALEIDPVSSNVSQPTPPAGLSIMNVK